MSAELTNSKEKLAQDFKNLGADFEDVIKAAASGAADKIAVAKERFQDHLHTLKVKAAGAEDMVIQGGKQAARATDDFVQENPWRAVGIGAGIGLIIGLLIGRR
jgi:ElaB/YqjD/DUF883 family membrane-anchored ribosome-binding protein